MRSAELAAAAGVTVRTLRHYHHLGVLPEPDRTSNGYRDYGADDLLLLLRIKLLADAGVPLADIPPALRDGELGDLLSDVDADLTARIEALTRQRELLRGWRGSASRQAASVIPPALSPALHALRAEDLPAAWHDIDRDVAVLLSRAFASRGSADELAPIYAWVTEPERADRVLEASRALARLGDDPSDADVREAVEKTRRLIAEWDGQPSPPANLDTQLLEEVIGRGMTTRGQLLAWRLVRESSSAPSAPQEP